MRLSATKMHLSATLPGVRLVAPFTPNNILRRRKQVSYKSRWFRFRCSETETSNSETTTDADSLIESPKEVDPFGMGDMMEEVTDARELGARGEGWMLSIIVASILLLFPPVNLFGLLSAIGWLLASTGAIFFLYSMLSLGKNNFPLPYPRKNAELVQKGIYAHVRHPMYSGLLLVCIGVAAITRNETRGALCVLLWTLIERLVQFEEEKLIGRFPQYEEYRRQTRKFVPGLY